MRLLLASSSTVYGGGYLDHLQGELADFFSGVARVLFVPFALHDLAGYAGRVRERFSRIGIAIDSLHEAADGRDAVERAEAFFVGGGNTFRLLDALARRNLLSPLRERSIAGVPYAGSSAGTNIAGLTIKTTNDMPIVHPVSLEALGLLPFQLNPHYVDPDPASTHMGETRDERIRQFHEEPENRAPVLALREPSWLRREGASLLLRGRDGLPAAGARLFRADGSVTDYGVTVDLSELLSK